MKRVIPLSLLVSLLVVLPDWMSAQSATDIVGGIAGALINAAANAPRNSPTPVPVQPVKQSARPARRQTASPAPAAARSKPRPSKAPTPSEPDSDSARRFDGTWLAMRSKTSPEGEEINQIFTMIVKNGKATKTLDTMNSSNPDKPPFESTHELHRKWIYSSTDLSAVRSSLTVQWSAGELSDWTPRTIPSDVIQNYGSPSPETSVYMLKGDELTRINDPNGITYRRSK